MQQIVSGTTRERMIRSSLGVIFVSGFAIAFLWDGFAGYPRDNARQLLSTLGLDSSERHTIDPKLTASEARKLVEEFVPGTDAAAVTDRLGPPIFEHGRDSYYLGPGGHLRARIEEGRVLNVEWTDGPHTETDLTYQRWIGYVLATVGLAFIFRFLRVVGTRVSLNDAGLKVGSRPRVPFDAMTALRADDSGKGGRIELSYSIDGRNGRVRLDDYVVKDFSAIVTAICERAGFPNPHEPDDDPREPGPSDPGATFNDGA